MLCEGKEQREGWPWSLSTVWNMDDDTIGFCLWFRLLAGPCLSSERLLNSAGLERCVRPRVLVADASTAKRSDVKRKHRDAEVGKAVQECFAGGGSVLMPVDAVGRVLELMVFLDEVRQALPPS